MKKWVFFSLIFFGLMAFLASSDTFLMNFQKVSGIISRPIKVGDTVIYPKESWILETHRSEIGGKEWLYGTIPIFWKKPVSSDIYYMFRINNNETLAFFEGSMTTHLDFEKMKSRCGELAKQCTQIIFVKKFQGFFFNAGKSGWFFIPELRISMYLSNQNQLKEIDGLVKPLK